MKVRVDYTYEVDADQLLDLEKYSGEKITRSLLRQLLTDLGKLGVEEQLAQGYMIRTTEVEP